MKTLLSLALMGAFALPALGQGQVQFQNRDAAAGIDAPIYGLFGRGLADGADPLYRAALLGGRTSWEPATYGWAGTLSMTANPDNPDLTWVGFRTGPAAGYLNVGSSAARVIPSVDWGQQALVQVVVWYGNYNSYSEAVAAYAPQSGFPLR